jgi:adenylate cyclase
VASRIESSCKTVAFDILISERTASSLPNYALLEAGALELKGKSGRTAVYAVVGDDRVQQSPEFAELLDWHKKFVQSLRPQGMDNRILENSEMQKVWHAWPGLREFYTAILERQKHFQRDPPLVSLLEDRNPAAAMQDEVSHRATSEEVRQVAFRIGAAD